ncbi:MAG: hypothetical protein Q9191_003880 [Dirinaria sp. TL-2023a]
MSTQTPASAELDDQLFPNHAVPPPSLELQTNIHNTFWSPIDSTSSAQDAQHHAAYFQYFRAQCDAWRASGCEAATETYQDLLELVTFLQTVQEERRDCPQIAAFFQLSLQKSHSTDDGDLRDFQKSKMSIDNAINFAVRVWLMLNVGAEKVGIYPGKSQVVWLESESLKELVCRCFPLNEPDEKVSDCRIPYSFNAYSLERIGGLEIVWTDHLPDHLRLNEDLCTVSLYHHASVLQSCKSASGIRAVYQEELLAEMLQTLALLLPRSNTKCKRWFRRSLKKYPKLDPLAGDIELLPGSRKLDRYRYWNERLRIVIKAYESEPRALPQWWHDRRNKVQWYTFWVAVLVLLLTIVFGLIQSITGAIQAYYASKAVLQSQSG